MMLHLDSERDIKWFYRLLPLYRSCLGKLFCYETNSNIDDNLKLVMEGLNIKNGRKRIRFVYDTCCMIIDKHDMGCNKCGFRDNRCYVQQLGCNKDTCGCCRWCRYRRNEGCPTSNLACKLFNCSEVTTRYEVIGFSDLPLLKLLNMRRQLIVKSDYFSLREDVLRDLYSISIIYTTIRILVRYWENARVIMKTKKTTSN